MTRAHWVLIDVRTSEVADSPAALVQAFVTNDNYPNPAPHHFRIGVTAVQLLLDRTQLGQGDVVAPERVTIGCGPGSFIEFPVEPGYPPPDISNGVLEVLLQNRGQIQLCLLVTGPLNGQRRSGPDANFHPAPVGLTFKLLAHGVGKLSEPYSYDAAVVLADAMGSWTVNFSDPGWIPGLGRPAPLRTILRSLARGLQLPFARGPQTPDSQVCQVPSLLDPRHSALTADNSDTLPSLSHSIFLGIRTDRTKPNAVHVLDLRHECAEWSEAGAGLFRHAQLRPFGLSPARLGGNGSVCVAGQEAIEWTAGNPAPGWVLDVSTPYQRGFLRWWNHAVVDTLQGAASLTEDDARVSFLTTLTAAAGNPPAPQHVVARYRVTERSLAADRRFEVRFAGLRVDGADASTLGLVQAVMGGFVDHSGRAFAASAVAEFTAPTDNSKAQVCLRLRNLERLAASVRVGALDLNLSDVGATLPPPHDELVEIRVDFGAAELSAEATVELRSMRLHFVFPVRSIAPTGQDEVDADESVVPSRRELIGKRRPGVVIIPLQPLQDDQGDLILSGLETFERDWGHTCTIDVNPKFARNPANLQLIVLDPSPYMIACVQARVSPYVPKGPIAVWSKTRGSAASWSMAGPADFTLRLPMQAIAEDMYDKDLPDAVQTSGPRWASPLLVGFGPPLVATMRSDRRELSVSEAKWNLRRTFDTARELPGAPLDALTFELTYGMSGTLTTSGMRFADVMTRLGQVQDLPANVPQSEWSRTTSSILGAMSRRIATLEPWHELDSPRTVWTQGLGFQLRASRQTERVPPRVGGRQVKGGVDRLFPSAGLREDAERTASVEASVTRPMFGALGGSGAALGVFSRGLTRINTTVALGRTHFASFTRIGRIAVLHHHAEYVRIFQRRVQSAPAELVGRAAMIKTDEYVQIRQKRRAFPDVAGDERSRGFVEAAVFQNDKIPVRSQDGWDVPEGWVLPLFVETNPSKKNPRLVFELATAPTRGTTHAQAEMTDPTKLYFFTSTRPSDGVDVDRWAPVPRVDFSLTDAPRPPASQHDGPSRPDSEVHQGHEAFTFPISASGVPVDLVAKRFESSVETVLSSITIARRTLTPIALPDALRKLLGAAEQAFDSLMSLRATADQISKILQSQESDAERQIRELLTDAGAARCLLELKLKNAANQDYPVLADLERLKAEAEFQLETWLPRAEETAKRFRQGIVQHSLAGAYSALLAADQGFHDSIQRLVNELVERTAPITSVPSTLAMAGEAAIGRFRGIVTEVAAAADSLEAAARAGKAQWQRDVDDLTHLSLSRTRALLEDDAVPLTPDAINAILSSLGDSVAALRDLANDLAKVSRRQITDLLASLTKPLEARADEVAAAIAEQSFSTMQSKLKARLVDEQKRLQDLASEPLTKWKDRVASGIDAMMVPLDDRVAEVQKNIATAVQQNQTEWKDAVGRSMITLTRSFPISDWEGTLAKRISNLRKIVPPLGRADSTPNPLLAELTQTVFGDLLAAEKVARRAVQGTQRRLSDAASKEAEAFNASAASIGDRGLRLLRAFGEKPIAEGLNFERDRIAYFFGQASVDVARVVATVASDAATAVGGLQALNLTLPITSFADRLIPSILPSELNAASLLKNLGGFDLSSLLGNLPFPVNIGDDIKIQHGVDIAHHRAWVKATIDTTLEDCALPVGPLTLTIKAPHLKATADVTAGVDGAPMHHTSGSITADWELAIGTTLLLRLKAASVRFDDKSGMQFDISPQRIELPEATRFLSDMLSHAPQVNGSGFSIKLVESGVLAQLAVGLPALSSGAFSLTGLALGAHFGLEFAGGFAITFGANLATRQRNFNLTILFLGGGGWFDFTARQSFPGSLTGLVDIGISAGATLAFDIAVASGSVQFLAYLDLEIDLGATQGFHVKLGVTLKGDVCVLGILSVHVEIDLEAEYQTGGTLQLSGTLIVEIHVFFFSLEVHQGFKKTLAGSGARTEIDIMSTSDARYSFARDKNMQRNQPTPPVAVVDAWLATFAW